MKKESAPDKCKYIYSNGNTCNRLITPGFKDKEGEQYCIFHARNDKKLPQLKQQMLEEISNATDLLKEEIKAKNLSDDYIGHTNAIGELRSKYILKYEGAYFPNNFDFFRNFSIEEDISFKKTVFNGLSDFSGAIFKGKVNFNDSIFSDEADFSYIKFEKGVNYKNVTFKSKADFIKTSFSSKLIFYNSVFQKIANFERCEFLGKVDFRKCSFNGKAIFKESHFLNETIFDSSIFNTGLDMKKSEFVADTFFQGVIFPQRCIFDDVKFFATSHFNDSNFLGNVHFTGTKFENAVFFLHSKFNDIAIFRFANFKSDVNFSESTFEKEAHFIASKFDKNVSFNYVAFNQAFFSGAIFHGDTSFFNSRFHGETRFNDAIFEREAIFSNILFEKELHFSRAQFRDKADFNRSVFKGTCYFDFSEYNQTPIFSPNSFFEGVSFNSISVHALKLRFQNEFFEKSTSFQNVDMSNLSFINCYLTNCSFLNSNVSDTIFSNCCFNYNLNWLKSRRRAFDEEMTSIEKGQKQNELKETVQILKHRLKKIDFIINSISTSSIPKKYKKHNYLLEHRELQEKKYDMNEIKYCYMQLKGNMDRMKDYDLANDFYYGEMEMKRLGEKWYKPKRWFLALYKFLSGYGNKPGQAIGVFFLLMAFFSFPLYMDWIEIKKDVNFISRNSWMEKRIEYESFYFKLMKPMFPILPNLKNSYEQNNLAANTGVDNAEKRNCWDFISIFLFNITAISNIYKPTYIAVNEWASYYLGFVHYFIRPIQVALIILAIRRKVKRGEE